MRPARFWSLSLILLILAASTAPSVSGQSSASPEAMSLTSNDFDDQALDLSIDGAGQYAVVAVKAATGLPNVGGVVGGSKHLYVWDMKTGQRQSTARYPFDGAGETPPVSAVVSMAPNKDGATAYAVGAAHKVATYGVGSGTVLKTYAFATGASVSAIAMNSGADRVAAGVSYAANGSLLVLDGNLNRLWAHEFTKPVTAMALRGGVLAVATDDKLFVYSSLTLQNDGKAISSCAAPACRQYEMGTTANPHKIRHMALSPNGAWLVVGTEQGEWWLFKTADLSVRSTASESGQGSVKGVAINGDDTTDSSLFAIAWNGGKMRLYRHNPAGTSGTGGVVTLGYEAALPGTGAAGAGNTGTPTSLAMSASGTYIVVSVGSKILGYTSAPPGSSAKQPTWTIDAGQAVIESAISPDAGRIVVAGQTKMLGYRQVTKATIVPPTYVEGGRTLPLVGKRVVPGDLARYTFTLKNDGTTDDNYTFAVLSPPVGAGWAIANIPGIALRAGESREVAVNVSVPNVAATSYPFTIGVRSLLKDSTNNCGADTLRPCIITFYANVSQVSRVQVVPGPGQARNFTVGSGEPTQFTFNIENKGNALALVNLSTDQITSSGGAWNVTYSKDRNIVVKGGETATITGQVTPPATALNGAFTRVRISALVNETAVGAPLELKALLNPSFGVQLTSEKGSYDLPGGRATPIVVKVQNTGNTPATVLMYFNITPKAALGTDWKIEAPRQSVEIQEGGRSATYTVYVTPLKEFPDVASITFDGVVKESLSTSSVKKDSLTIGIARLPEDIPPAEPWYTRLLPGPHLLLVLAALGLVALRSRKR